jgi:hypothetical protein
VPWRQIGDPHAMRKTGANAGAGKETGAAAQLSVKPKCEAEGLMEIAFRLVRTESVPTRVGGCCRRFFLVLAGILGSRYNKLGWCAQVRGILEN